MSAETDPHATRTSPILGRIVGGIFVALVVMVVVGVFGIWRHAHREQAWRERVTQTDTFITPTNH